MAVNLVTSRKADVRCESAPRLSKSRFIAGLQCPKRLWWTVHEPEALELARNDAERRIYTRGNRVNELARSRIPGGVLIDLPYHHTSDRVAATAKALAELLSYTRRAF